jgi:hypothetical protein
MQVVIQLEYRADKKEPLAGMIGRVAEAFEAAGLMPSLTATFGDGLIPGGVSAVERALKKYPDLASFERNDALMAGIPPIRRLTNRETGAPFPLEDVLKLAEGMPRSLPFHTANVQFNHPEFGIAAAQPSGMATLAGILVSDLWWINGRNRSLSAVCAVESESASKALPPPPAGVAAVLAAFGKPQKSSQFIASELSPRAPPAQDSPAAAITRLTAEYKADMPNLLRRIGMPYDLPPLQEALRARFASGPLKPTLVSAFGPRGYDCKGDHGTFTLRRRTPANHVVDIDLDVGTWSRMVTANYCVQGPDFRATLHLPVSANAGAGQYPIGDVENWERIVANLAAIVDELDRTFVPAIEAEAEPAPEWYEPAR